MKKKIISALLVAGMLTSNLLVACGMKEYVESMEVIPERETEIISKQEQEMKVIKDEVVPVMTGALDMITNLSAESNTEICIDYAIENVKPVQEFGYALFKEHLQEENPVLSPVSAYIALTMAGNGAAGNTYDEFLKVLGENGDMTVMSDYMMNELPVETEQLKVKLANSVWIDDEFTVDDDWIGEITSLYDAEAFQHDLATEQAMHAMNEWVNIHTNGLMKEMINRPLENDTRLVLFNTLYFKGLWRNAFSPESTYEETFYAKDGEIQAPMMHEYMEYYSYFEDQKVSGVVMPYRDGNYAFVAFMPRDEKEDIREIYQAVTEEQMSDWLKDSESTLVNLTFPKFEVSFDQELNQSLQNLGLVDAFDKEKADFSKMGTSVYGYPLYISLVRQKAVVKLDEEGTEAAAVTEIAMVDTCALIEGEPIDVCFNRPFGYMIMDMETEVPLFMGIMDNPAIE